MTPRPITGRLWSSLAPSAHGMLRRRVAPSPAIAGHPAGFWRPNEITALRCSWPASSNTEMASGPAKAPLISRPVTLTSPLPYATLSIRSSKGTPRAYGARGSRRYLEESTPR